MMPTGPRFVRARENAISVSTLKQILMTSNANGAPIPEPDRGGFSAEIIQSRVLSRPRENYLHLLLCFFCILVVPALKIRQQFTNLVTAIFINFRLSTIINYS